LFVTLFQGVRQLEVTSFTDVMKDAAAAAAGDTAGSHNVWTDRHEFYSSAVPRDSAEEERMLQAALEMSKVEHCKSTQCHSLSSVLLLVLL